MAPVVKNLPTNTREARDAGSIPVLGRSPGVENDNPLQYSCPENSIHRGGWQATAPGVSESDPAEHAGHTPAVCPLVRTQRSPCCYAHPVAGGMVGKLRSHRPHTKKGKNLSLLLRKRRRTSTGEVEGVGNQGRPLSYRHQSTSPYLRLIESSVECYRECRGTLSGNP